MRILLTGATGLLGRAVFARLSRRSDIVLAGTSFSRDRPPFRRVDLTSPGEAAALFAEFHPDFVIHAAAERRPDVVDGDTERAQALNVEATARIAESCRAHGASLLYISTDYVFDGSAPPYFPDSPENPLNGYGKMKLEGERRIRDIFGHEAVARAFMLRISILYGPVETLGESAVTELAAKLLKRQPCSMEHWASRYPLHVDDVAQAIERIVDAWASGSAGPESTFLLSGPETLTKYEMALVMARILGVDAELILPDPSRPAGAPRPKDCRMDTSLLAAIGYVPQIPFEKGIAAVLEGWRPR
jgi:dTDP-4-dehydrorhamnose reductase